MQLKNNCKYLQIFFYREAFCLFLLIENVGNFQTNAKNGLAASTLRRGLLCCITCAFSVFLRPSIRQRGKCSSTLLFCINDP